MLHQLEEGRATNAGPTLAPAWGTMKDLVFALSRASDDGGNTSNPSMLLEPELQLGFHSLAPAPANANASAYTYLPQLLDPAASSQGDPSPLYSSTGRREDVCHSTVGTREGDALKGAKGYIALFERNLQGLHEGTQLKSFLQPAKVPKL